MASTTAIVPMAKQRYSALSAGRNTALTRARDNSKLTIPGLVPEDGQDANATFSQPYQSVGAKGVNNISSWLLVTQFPPDTPFARLSIHEDTAEGLGSGLGTVREGLARISTKAQLLIETAAYRPILMEVFRHLVVAGNVLLFAPLDGTTPRMYRLDQYVVVRDERGEFTEIVTKEMVYPSTLDPATLAACKVAYDPTKPGQEKPVELYTHVRRLEARGDLQQYQEINGIVVPGSEGTQPYDKRGWLALRWQAVPGSDYGRAMVSEYYGDLLSLEDLSKAIVQFAAVASRIIHIVEPSSMLDIDDLAAAESGDFLYGNRERIGTLQLEKSQDFTITNTVAERIEARLNYAFMLRAGMTRDAERVTAEEIRAVAQELENVLGGTYTVLASELQLPLMRRLLYILQKKGEAPELPETVQPTIVTGFAAMGKTHSGTKIRAFLRDLVALVPQAAERLNIEEIALRLGEADGVEDVAGLIIDEATFQQQQQAAMTNQAALSAAPNIAKGAMDAMNTEQGPIPE